MSNMKVTSLVDLKKIAKGKIVELPGWDDDTPFYARLSRPSLQKMVSKGDIPNSLLNAATELFFGRSTGGKVDMKQLSDLQHVVVESALLEPTVEEIEEIGLELTDQQIIAIFNYTQEGLKGLEKFRKKETSNEGN